MEMDVKFFIVGSDGNEVPEAGCFTCYSKARKACIEYSRNHVGLYCVSFRIPGIYTVYSSGKPVKV